MDPHDGGFFTGADPDAFVGAPPDAIKLAAASLTAGGHVDALLLDGHAVAPWHG